jgi:DNA-directed RNA polymerase specialized sigma24 family protein
MPRLAPKGRLKAVLKLRKHGMTYVGIAEKLNITLANVEYDLRRARGLGTSAGTIQTATQSPTTYSTASR